MNDGQNADVETPDSFARRWMAADPDPVTRAELGGLLAVGDRIALQARFGARLRFGTAGLRGPLGAGPNRMNRLTVRAAAVGLAVYLKPASTVIVGYDGRTNSEVFSWDVARVLRAAGHRALRFSKLGPTPLLAFAVLHFEADAGVMITASHNPRQDNGMKVYLGDGAQLAPPTDLEIEALMGTALEAIIGEAPGARLDRLALAPSSEVESLGSEVAEAYVMGALSRVRLTAAPDARARLRIVHTAMHGVGTELAVELLRKAGFTDVHSVAAQADPDPAFPTVAFPNPEEPGALDLAIALARSVDADLLLANDPDADRLAVGVPDGQVEGGWQILRGDEVGWLLAEHLNPPSAATTVVSSSLLRAMAADRGWSYRETLTGFKWLARTGAAFAYEEALGYAVCDLVRDKDGLTAALVFADLAAGASPLDRLAAIEDRYGRHETAQINVRDDIVGLMRRARRTAPTSLAGIPVFRVADLEHGDGSLPPSDVVIVELGTESRPVGRVVIRPSGTEPKAKIYLEAIEPGLTLETLRGAVEAWLEL